MKDDADPLDGWTYDEYIKCVPAAKNDVCGAFFFYLRNMLLAFCKRVRSCKMAFQLLAVDAVTLPDYLKDVKFDRIEVSNICDRGYVGPAVTLATFSSMLKAKSENPKATLLMLFLNAVREEESESRDSLDPTAMAHRGRQIKRYLDIKQPIIDAAMGKGGMSAMQYMTSPDFTLVTDSLNLCGDFDAYFKRFLKSADPHKGTSMYDLARQHGMRIKSKHTIIEPWPYRLTEKTTKEEFKVLLSESTCGHERYMEFERA